MSDDLRRVHAKADRILAQLEEMGAEPPAMTSSLKSLLRSRKFLLAVFGVVQTLVLHYLSVPDDVWQHIVTLVMVLIGSIALEDAAEKRRDTVIQETVVED